MDIQYYSCYIISRDIYGFLFDVATSNWELYMGWLMRTLLLGYHTRPLSVPAFFRCLGQICLLIRYLEGKKCTAVGLKHKKLNGRQASKFNF